MRRNHLIWNIVRNNNCYLFKQKQHKFSKDPLNMSGKNTLRDSGLANAKAIGIKTIKSGQGVYLIKKKTRNTRCPAKSIERITFAHNKRKNLQKIRNIICRTKYRRELKMLALRRASAMQRVKVEPKEKKDKK